MSVFKQWILRATIMALVMAMEVSADVGKLGGNEEYARHKRRLSITEYESKGSKSYPKPVHRTIQAPNARKQL